jgi:hypothetical protein
MHSWNLVILVAFKVDIKNSTSSYGFILYRVVSPQVFKPCRSFVPTPLYLNLCMTADLSLIIKPRRLISMANLGFTGSLFKFNKG